MYNIWLPLACKCRLTNRSPLSMIFMHLTGSCTGHVVMQFGVRGWIGNPGIVQCYGNRQVRIVHRHGTFHCVGARNKWNGLDHCRPEAEPDQRLAGAGESRSRWRHGRVSFDFIFCYLLIVKFNNIVSSNCMPNSCLAKHLHKV